MSDPTVWQGPTENVPVVNANGNVFEEVQVAAAAQTLFTLTSFEYTPGSNSIFVWKNGEMLRRVVDYVETSSTEVTATAPAALNDEFVFVSIAINQLIAPVVFNGIPSGGTDGQLLTKVGASDYAAEWSDPDSITTLLDAQRANVASASTVNLGIVAAITRNVQITGSIQVDGFQVANGQVWVVRFAAPLVLKNNASIVTQSGYDIRVTAGDTCLLRATADNVVEVIGYSRHSSSVPRIVNDFRLTALSGSPIPDVDVALAPTLYLTPYTGNAISLFNGTSWDMIVSNEVSVSLAGLVGSMYDMFCYNNAGVPTLETQIWASDIARSVALVKQDGIYVKAGDTTRRYIGSFLCHTANNTADTARTRYVWNYYNRVLRNLHRQEPVASWGYTVAAYRFANNNPLNVIEVVNGIPEDSISVDLNAKISNSAGAITVEAAIGIDAVLTPVVGSSRAAVTVTAGFLTSLNSKYTGQPPLGYHRYTWLETSPAVGVSTWSGAALAGIYGMWRC